jgi:glyoxylase-like metal-dependent hydrolase (beta-lactamase superfamily II)
MYTGAVSVGGPPDIRELPELTITKVAVGPFDNNCYFLTDRATGAVVLIDAANEPERLLSLVGSQGLDRVITTHRHADHWQALAPVVEATGAPVVAHPLDAPALPVPVASQVTDGDTVPVGSGQLTVIHLVGHTPGSIALLYQSTQGRHLFTGDCLFPGGVGRTTRPDEFESLYRGVVEKLFDRLPDDTWVYPGHGADTTLGAERPHLEEWRERGW